MDVPAVFQAAVGKRPTPWVGGGRMGVGEAQRRPVWLVDEEAVGAEARPLSDPETAERGGGFPQRTEVCEP